MKSFAGRAMLAALVIMPAFRVAVEAARIKDIRVRNAGAGAVEKTFVLAHTSAHQGEEMDPAAVSQDVKNLLATGIFSDVKVEVEQAADGVVLTYVLKNKLRLAAPVVVKGVKNMTASRVSSLLDISPGELFDEAALAVRARKVREEYRKEDLPDADIEWAVKVTDEALGTATVTALVREGRKATLRRMAFTGNEHVSSRSLRKALGSPPWWNVFEWLSRKPFDADEMDAMRETIRMVYLTKGYLDAAVAPVQTSELRPGSFTVVFPIEEGPLYRMGTAFITGVELFPEEELLKQVTLGRGAAMSLLEVERSVDAVRQYYTSRGYLRTSVKYTMKTREPEAGARGDERVADLAMEVLEGTLVHVRNVYVRGNTVTRDRVIRRELAVYPGDVFDEKLIRRSEGRLRGLGFFSKVATRAEPTGTPDRSDLAFEVEEQRTGSIMLGGGFSSVDSFLGYIEVSEGNFDIASWPPKGDGQKLKLRGQLGSKTSSAELSFVEPWFLGRRLSLGLDLYGVSYDYDDYDERKQGGAISLGTAVNMFFTRATLRYALEKQDITNITDTNEYFRISGDRAGEPYSFEYTNQVKSALSLNLARETRDNVFFPSRGSRVDFGAFVSGGILGGDSRIYGWELEAERHFPLWKGHVLSLHGRAKVVEEYGGSGDVPIFDRLYVGGGRTIRGFRYRGVGPKVARELVPGTGEMEYRMIGGKTLACGNIEYTVPLVESLKLAAFMDAGNVSEDAYDFGFNNRFAASAGIELKFDIQMFPIRINYARALERDDPHTVETPWGFWIGSGF